MDLFVGDGDGDDGAGEIVAAAAVAAAVNPLGSSNPSNVEDAEQMEAEAEADERTVVSEVPREVGWFRVLSRPDGRPSLLCRYIQAVPVLMVMVQLFDYTPKGDAQFVGRAWEDFSEGAQSLISLAMFGLCFALVSPIMLVTSIQGALKPGGELEQLGAGSAAISVSSERRLRILRRFIMLPAALVVSMGTASHAMACVVAYRKYFLGEELQQCLVLQDGTERCFKDPLGPAYMFGLGGCVLGLGTCVLLGFWPSMILASSLCRDQISKLMVVLRKADPSDKASWDRDVVGPAFAIDHAMRTLSRGWGSALLGLGLASWCMAFNFFCKAINNEYVDAKDQTRPGGGARANYLVFFVFYAMLPLLVSLEVAQTSTRCDVSPARKPNRQSCCLLPCSLSWLFRRGRMPVKPSG